MSIDVFPATVLNATLWNGQTYEEGSFTVTASGFTTVTSGTAYYRRIGQCVTLQFPRFDGTSNATSLVITGIPVSLSPVINMTIPCHIQDNGIQKMGMLRYLSGAWDILVWPGASWVASGVKSVFEPVITYPLASALSAPGWTGQSYEEGTFTVTATGFSGTAPSGTARYVRVGKQVTVMLPSLTGTANATTMTLTGLPVSLQAVMEARVFVVIVDNSVYTITTPGLIVLSAASSTFTVYKDGQGNPWTASGTRITGTGTLSYVTP